MSSLGQYLFIKNRKNFTMKLRFRLSVLLVMVAGTGMLLLHQSQYSTSEENHGINKCTQCFVHRFVEVNLQYECVVMKFTPPTHICLYPDANDKWISAALRKSGSWEGDMVELFQSWLKEDPDLGVIDLGANLGMYSLLAAKMGHEVLAVEPQHETVMHFHKAVLLNKVQNKITLLQNGVSNSTSVAEIHTDAANNGGTFIQTVSEKKKEELKVLGTYTHTITMDDLLYFCNFQKAVMKIDIEGFEHLAFQTADKLLTRINVTKILMEWMAMPQKGTHEDGVILGMIHFLRARGFTPKNLFRNAPLTDSLWRTWPNNIKWIKDQHISS